MLVSFVIYIFLVVSRRCRGYVALKSFFSTHYKNIDIEFHEFIFTVEQIIRQTLMCRSDYLIHKNVLHDNAVQNMI